MQQTFVFQKPDMDTVFSAWILGFHKSSDSLVVMTPEIKQQMLENPNIYCIECGGSGRIERKNFDHHNSGKRLSCACMQAYRWKNISDPWIHRMVEYVQFIDGDTKRSIGVNKSHAKDIFLSGIYSGMRIVFNHNLTEQFLNGIEIFHRAFQLRLDPWKHAPNLPEWSEFKIAKRKQLNRVNEYIKEINFYKTGTGKKIGYLFAPIPGIHALLRQTGCMISIAAGLACTDNRRYTTISSDCIKVSELLPDLLYQENGWGGPSHGRIIASPKSGTRLTQYELVEMVRSAF